MTVFSNGNLVPYLIFQQVDCIGAPENYGEQMQVFCIHAHVISQVTLNFCFHCIQLVAIIEGK